MILVPCGAKLVLITVHARSAYVLHTVCAEQATPMACNGSVWHKLQLSTEYEVRISISDITDQKLDWTPLDYMGWRENFGGRTRRTCTDPWPLQYLGVRMRLSANSRTLGLCFHGSSPSKYTWFLAPGLQ